MAQEDTIVSALENVLSVNRVALRVPPFIAADPELWFAILEENFQRAGITADATKFGHVTAVLEPQYALQVRDIIVNRPETNAYETLKRELVKRLSSSQEQKIRRLLESEEMGDRKPSQFLRHLQGLAGTSVTEPVVRTLWLGRLPNHVQAILAAQKDLDLTKVADLADGIMDLAPPRPVVAEAASRPSTDALSASPNANLLQQIASLCQEVKDLRLDVTELRSRPGYRPRGRSGYRADSRARSRPRSTSTSRDDDGSHRECWYHRRFGASARYCEPRCSFAARNPGNDKGSR